MRNTNACRLTTAILVFSLFLSTLVMIPGATVQGADSGYLLWFNVVDSDTQDEVEGATALIEEVHTGMVFENTTDSSGQTTFSPSPGYYRVSITKIGYYDYYNETVIRFDGQSHCPLGDLKLKPIPEWPWLNVSVVDSDTGNQVSDVTLQVIDVEEDYQLYEHTDNGIFNVSVYPASYKLIVTAPGYAKNVTTVEDVSVNKSVDIEMDPSVVVRAFVDLNGAPPTGLSAYMVSTNTSLDPDLRILAPRTIGSNSFKIDAYPGEFNLLVAASGAGTKIIPLNIPLNVSDPMQISLDSPQPQSDEFEITFQDDWTEFDLVRSFTYNFDMTHPALAYSELPSLRMQIDFALGDGDGVVNETEVNAFEAKLKEFGPLNVTTQWLLTINGTSFLADERVVSSLEGIEGDVNSTDQFSGVLETHYSSIESIDVGAPTYTGEVYASYDQAATNLDYRYVLNLPDGYELVDNTTATGRATVSGYTEVIVDPEVGAPGKEKVTLDFEESKDPTAVAGVDTDGEAYAVIDDSSIVYYILRNGTEITFTADGSYDPNGNPLSYTWDFGDGMSKTVSTETVTHTYTQTALNLTVTLTVTDVADLEDEDSFFVKVDGIDPVPVIYVDGVSVAAGSEYLTDQNKAVVFNGAHSFDYINSTDEVPPAGIIKSWHWDFGDGNSTTVLLGENPNVTHAYTEAGNYSLTLNATDAVGHNHTIGITMVVNDSTPPSISFKVLNSRFKDVTQDSPIENETLYFNATATKDNVDDLSNLTFRWEFGDGTNITGTGDEFANVTHAYAAIDTFTVKLTVTDRSDNSANKTQEITVLSSPRPDLRLVSVTHEPGRFTEGETGQILVNVTNVGNDNATGIRATFYLVRADGSRSLIGESNSLTVNGEQTNLLQVDQSGVITFNWKPGTKGDYTISVEVTADREIVKGDNTGTVTIGVDEAGWKAAAIYGGIFAVIVVIIVLFYFRKRLPMLGGKGSSKSRRGKK